MAIVTIPAGMLFGPQCGMGQRRYDTVDQSETDGSSDVRLRGHPRWTISLAAPQKLTLAEAAVWRSTLLALNGKVNVLAAYDPVRLVPRGTLRGTPTLSAAAFAGEFQLNVTSSTSGMTLLAGDLIQVGSGFGTSQLVEVAQDVTLSPSGAVFIYPPLRSGFASGTALQWDRPVAYYRNNAENVAWQYSGAGLHVSGLSFDGLESWR